MNQSEGNVTSLSLLDGIRKRDPVQWQRFAKLYSPLIFQWCRQARVPQQDIADVIQDVFRVVAIKIDDFRRDRAGDSFHGWLWTITRNKLIDYFRQSARRPVAAGGSTAQQNINQLMSDIPEDWEAEQEDNDKAALYRRALDLLKTDFKPGTWQAFWRVTMDEAAPANVASELGMSVGAVYNAKYKVLRRLRSEFEGLI